MLPKTLIFVIETTHRSAGLKRCSSYPGSLKSADQTWGIIVDGAAFGMAKYADSSTTLISVLKPASFNWVPERADSGQPTLTTSCSTGESTAPV